MNDQLPKLKSTKGEKVMSTSEVENLLNALVKKCQEGNYIYRGVPRHYDKVSSSLYREYEKEKIFTEHFYPVHIEEDIVGRAKKHFPDSTSNIEILTELRHFGAKTTLIDFSRSIYVALFFACSGEEGKDEDGELILLNTEKVSSGTDIDYAKPEDLQDSIIEPASTQQSQKRVVFQSSVFVHVPKGHLEKEKFFTHPIAWKDKRDLLEHLRKFHNISNDTIYNDLHGFITNEKNFHTAVKKFYRGLSASEEGKRDEAIKYYSEAIELKPDFAVAYYNKGNARSNLKQYKEAIEDYSRAIELEPDYAEAYNNRGGAKLGLEQGLEQYKAAIEDYNEAIKLDLDYAEAYCNRGTAKSHLGQHEAAIEDYNEATKLRSSFAEAYFNRGIAKTTLKQYEAAIEDYGKVIELEPDDAAAYNNRGAVKFDLGQYKEAIKDYNKAIELDSDYAGAYSNRGEAKSNLAKADAAQYDAAIKDYEKAIELEPERESQLRPMIEELQTKITNNTDECLPP